MKLRLIALFMLVLVLSMPFTYASFISDIVATGSNGAENIISEDDTVDFDIYVDIKDPEDLGFTPADVASDDLLIVKGSESHSVTNCAWYDEPEGIVKCSKSLGITVSPGASIYSYDVLFGGTPYRPQPYLYVDTTEPLFSQTSISAVQNANSIDISVTSTDSSDYSSSICAGLDYFEPSIDGTVLGRAEFTGNCTETVTETFPLNIDFEGTTSLCVNVYDLMGKFTTKCADVSLDSGAPTISEKTFLGQNDKNIFAVGPSATYAKVSFLATDVNGVSSAKIRYQNTNYTAPCQIVSQTSAGRQYLCETNTFEISSGLQSVEIFAEDVNGNVATEVLSRTFEEDTQGPVFNQIGRDSIADRIYISSNMNLNVTFTEKSMYDGTITMFLGSRSYTARSCEPTATDTWVCVFRLSGFSEGEYQIQFQGTDDFGNEYEQVPIPVTAVVDTTPPLVYEDQITVSGLNSFGPIPVVSVPGRAKIDFPVYDNSPVTVKADFSHLLRTDGSYDANYNVILDECEENSCNITSAQIGANELTEVPLIITDAAGNSVSLTVDIPIVTQSDSSFPWSANVELSPEALDRAVSLVIPQKAFAQIELVDPTDKIKGIVTIDFNNCVAPENVSENQGSIEFLQDKGSFIASNGTFTYISFQTMQADLFVDSLVVDCRFKITAYTDEKLYVEDQITLPVVIPFYNNPVGMPDEALQEKIESAIEDTGGMLETLDTVYKWVQIIQKICQVLSVIATIASVITNGITLPAGIICDSLAWLAPAKVACEKSASTACIASEGISLGLNMGLSTIVGSFCAFINCELNFCGGFAAGPGSSDGFEVAKNVGDMSLFALDGTGTGASVKPGGMQNYNTELGLSALGSIEGAAAANGMSVWDPNGLPSQICHLCIPGILKKFHDYRQIQCGYALCLIEEAQLGSLSESACDEIRSAMECKFWAGELFSALPFAHLWDNLLNAIAMMMADPIAALMGIMYLGCQVTCAFWQTGNVICSMSGKINQVVSLVKMVQGIFMSVQNFLNFEETADSCDAMESAYDSFKGQQQSFSERLVARQGVAG